VFTEAYLGDLHAPLMINVDSSHFYPYRWASADRASAAKTSTD